MADPTTLATRIMLVEDHISLRQALALAFSLEPDLHVQAQAGSLAEARQRIATEAPSVDVAVLDLDLPDGDGSTLISLLREANPQITTLVLTGSTDARAQSRAIHAGADGFVHKSSSLAEIVDKLKRCAKGEPVVSTRDIFNAMASATKNQPAPATKAREAPRLTRRERDVLGALAEGLNDREIAEHLYVGKDTVRTHVDNIMRKLGATSRMQALVLAIRHGLVSID